MSTTSNEIFVFGSNRQGRHGKGAALAAVQKYGATYGQGEGLQGRSYAIPTKITPYTSAPLSEIREAVQRFVNFARDHPELTFNVTPIGCGFAGYRYDQIGPMFNYVSPNVNLPDEFVPY